VLQECVVIKYTTFMFREHVSRALTVKTFLKLQNVSISNKKKCIMVSTKILGSTTVFSTDNNKIVILKTSVVKNIDISLCIDTEIS